jgi:Flp pilus assembly protein TadB
MSQRIEHSNDHSEQHGTDPIVSDERRARRPSMAIILLLMAATIAVAFVAFDGLSGPTYSVIAKIAFVVLLVSFVGTSVARITRFGQNRAGRD